MSNAGALLDKARERRSIASDKALAERIGVQRSLVSGWRSGAVPMPDARIVEIAELAGEDAGAWLLNIHAEQDDAKIRSYWIALSKKLAAAAAIVLMAGAGASGIMSLGKAKNVDGSMRYGIVQSIHYGSIVQFVRRARQLIQHWMSPCPTVAT